LNNHFFSDEDNRLDQIIMATQYGANSAIKSISTPCQNKNIANKQQGVNMLESQSNSIIDQFQPTIRLLLETINFSYFCLVENCDVKLCINTYSGDQYLCIDGDSIDRKKRRRQEPKYGSGFD
jgi:hypothetical protein